MGRVMLEIRVPIAVSYVKIPCQDYCVIYICYVLTKDLKSSLIAIWVYVNHEVYVSVIMEDQDIDIMVVDNV